MELQAGIQVPMRREELRLERESWLMKADAKEAMSERLKKVNEQLESLACGFAQNRAVNYPVPGSATCSPTPTGIPRPGIH